MLVLAYLCVQYMYHLEYMYIVSAYKYILAYGSNLLAYMAHAVAKPCNNLFHRWLELVRVDGACGSTLLAYAAHTVENC